MIEEQWRYFAPEGDIAVGGPSKWYIIDWDQRRNISVKMDEEQDEEDLAIKYLGKHIDTLGPEVVAIHVSQDGELISTSSDPDDDKTTCVYHPPLEHLQPPVHVRTILRSELREVDRTQVNVDLVSYTSSSTGAATKVIFKYYFIFQFMEKRLDEINLWMRLPPHPNIVPFDYIVLDEVRGNVVGFTSVYIPGGTLHETTRVFKLKWLERLIRVVDDLNLKYGIAHQDVAARNLLVDDETDSLMIFDFNYSARIGSGYSYAEDRNDVKGVIFTLYEIITLDGHFRAIRHELQDPADVEGMGEWICHPGVKLSHPVSEYRSVLDQWVKTRREGEQMTYFKKAPEYIDWPAIPEPPKTAHTYNRGTEHERTVTWSRKYTFRREDRRDGNTVINWGRPAQNKLRDGDVVLATGKLVRGISETEEVSLEV